MRINLYRINKTTFTLLVFMVLSLQSTLHAGPPPAKAGISPSRFEITYDGKSKTHVITFINYSNRNISARLSLANWTLDNEEIVEIAPTPQSLDQWMLITPINFKVPPKESQTIRFAIRPKSKPKAGEHRAMIWIDEVLDSSRPSKGMTAKFRFGIAVYLNVPPVYAKGKLQKVIASSDTKDLQVALKYANSGNVHDRLTGTVSLWKVNTTLSKKQKSDILSQDIESKELLSKVTIPSRPILAKLKQTMVVSLPKPKYKGRYLLVVDGHFKNGVEFTKEQIITIKAH